MYRYPNGHLNLYQLVLVILKTQELSPHQYVDVLLQWLCHHVFPYQATYLAQESTALEQYVALKPPQECWTTYGIGKCSPPTI